MKNSFIEPYLKAGFPGLIIRTLELHRAEEQISQLDGWQFCHWDCCEGLRPLSPTGSQHVDSTLTPPVEAINWLSTQSDTVLIMTGLQTFADDPMVSAAILNAIPRLKSLGSCMVLIAPDCKLPPQLTPYFHLVDMPLPTDEDLLALQVDLGSPHNISKNPKAARTAAGLTHFQCETAYSLSLVKEGFFSSKIVADCKAQMIKTSGLLEFYPPANPSDVGGLEPLKAFVTNRMKAFEPKSTLPHPKGILLVGIPGTGKTLTARATASILQFPLLRLDIGTLKNGIVGESERRMREALKVISAFGNCVVMIDEIEKSLSNTRGNGSTDGGTSQNMFGTLLQWMNDQKSAFIVATANNVRHLPPELLRAGRFDALFYLDLPTLSERKQIISIINKKYGTAISSEFAERTEGYSGAEIEQLIRDSMFDGLEIAYANLIPLSVSMKEDISDLRAWAKSRARAANSPDEAPVKSRKLRVITNPAK